MKKVKYIFCTVLILLGLNFIWACRETRSHSKQPLKTFTVRTEAIQKTLYFTGTIQPLHEYSLNAPMDGVVETMPYHFGQLVKQEDVVLTLDSAELQKQYNETLTEYLKAKDNYAIARAKFIGTEDLWQSGLLSKNSYLSEKSSLNTARITLVQATQKLSEMLEKAGDANLQDLSTLSFAKFDKVRLALNSKHNLILLKAPGEGVLLYPPKTTEDKNAHLTIGTSVKAGQVLALIGDLKGIRVEIDVPEVDINKIKPGISALIRSVAFPKEPLLGKVVALNAQASPSNGSALPSFTALVEVNQLSESQKNWVKVGMSATVELLTPAVDKLLIPVAAVKHNHGQNQVQVLAKNGDLETRVVSTGTAEIDKVEVDAGLKPGEVVVYG